MMRDTSGQLWMIECNPRFPAWIHGSTIAGRNLAAAVVEKASGVRAQRRATCEEFARIVLEVPVRPEFPLPPLAEPYSGGFGHSLKHPSGSLVLADRLHKLKVIDGNGTGSHNSAAHSSPPPVLPESYINDLDKHDLGALATPSWLFLEDTASTMFRRAKEMALRVSSNVVKVTNAYSIKTNPDERLVRLARQHGFLAEAISLLEVQKALSVGFKPDEVILNGPGKWWPAGLLPTSPLHAVFCDSIADLQRVASSLARGQMQSNVVGIRLRPPTVPSRFGIRVDTPQALNALVEAIGTCPAIASSASISIWRAANVGVTQWWHLYDSLLKWCLTIETLTQRRVEHLDLGGGWFPCDWHVNAEAHFAEAIARARRSYRTSSRSFRSRASDGPADDGAGMRLLELEREDGEVRQAVVDASVAECRCMSCAAPNSSSKRAGRLVEAGAQRQSTAARQAVHGARHRCDECELPLPQRLATFWFFVMQVLTTGACLMNLAEAKRLEISERGASALQAAIEAWTYQPVSKICDHGQQCCAVAREWFFAMDRSHTPASEP